MYDKTPMGHGHECSSTVFMFFSVRVTLAAALCTWFDQNKGVGSHSPSFVKSLDSCVCFIWPVILVYFHAVSHCL